MKTNILASIVWFTGLLLFAGCAPTKYTNWLKTTGTDTVKCSVMKDTTTTAGFDEQCGKAYMMQESRGCRMYQRDDGVPLYYCFKDGKLRDILTYAEWAAKRGE